MFFDVALQQLASLPVRASSGRQKFRSPDPHLARPKTMGTVEFRLT
jgi:hypothetical protein